MPHADTNLEPIPDSKRGQHLSNPHDESVHQAILGVAKHLFARYGYEGTTVGVIARSVGISQEQLRDHFPDKLSILMAVFEDGWNSINQRLQDIVVNSVNAREATLSMMAVMMRILDRDGDLARLLLFEGRRPHPETGEIMLSAGYRWFARLCAELVVRGQKDGSFRVTFHPRAIATMLTGALEGLMRDRLIAEQQPGATVLTGAQLMTAFDALVSYFGPEKLQPGH